METKNMNMKTLLLIGATVFLGYMLIVRISKIQADVKELQDANPLISTDDQAS